MLILSSIILGCAWFVLVNALLSGLVALLASARPTILQRLGATNLLVLRLLPAAGSLGFVLLLFLPAHWQWEMAGTNERFGMVLYLLAAAAVPLAGASIVRATWALRQSRRLQQQARAAAVASSSDVLEIAGFSGVSLAGVFRTTIFLGASLRSALTSSELAAAIAHERAHRRAWDNPKRFAVFCAPDFLARTKAAARIEAAWRAESEYAADAAAAGSDARRGADLASALIKVARLLDAGPPAPRFPLWSLFCERELLEGRVRLLVAQEVRTRHWPLGVILAAVLLASAAWLAALPYDVYRLSEALVGFLP